MFKLLHTKPDMPEYFTHGSSLPKKLGSARSQGEGVRVARAHLWHSQVNYLAFLGLSPVL